MDALSNRLRPGHLVVGALAVVGIQFTMVAATGFHPPEFRSGFDRPAETVRPTTRLSPEDRRHLENLLSPPPILDWSERTELPGVHQTPQSATATPGTGAGGTPPKEAEAPEAAGQASEEQLALLERPPAEPEATPEPAVAAPEPDIPEIDYGLYTIEVEPVYLRTLPELESLSPNERKRRFIAVMLPLMLRANQELEYRRELVLKAIGENDLEKLKQWGRLYGYEPEAGGLEEYGDELLRRVAPVPVSIALAQAAVESGWGTSRFAVHGNALMGQWAWRLDAGIRPREARYDNQVVRAFASLFDSVRAYMHNLNSHLAYSGFRELRDGKTDSLDSGDIFRLVGQLVDYSEEGGEYTDTLKEIISSNDLVFYDRAVLKPE